MKAPQNPKLPQEKEKFIAMELLENSSSSDGQPKPNVLQPSPILDTESLSVSIGGLSVQSSIREEDRTSSSLQSTRIELSPLSTFGIPNRDTAKIISTWQHPVNATSKEITNKFDWLKSSSEFETNLNLDRAHFSKEEQRKIIKIQNNKQFTESRIFSDPSVYGSLPDQMDSLPSEDQRRSSAYNAARSSQRVIFCIHGKPSSCCATQIHSPSSDTSLPPQTITIETDEHCHKKRHEGVNVKARRKILIASVLCVFFMLVEMVGGFISNSLAIATDAAHLLTDFASFMISLFSIWVAARKPTRVFLFGWHRAEVLGALVSVLTIWVVTGILVYVAIERIIHKDYEIETEYMLITSVFGVLVNLVMGCALHQHGHHSHGSSGHGHDHEENQNEEEYAGENINVRAAFIHVIGDFIQSTGVFIAALLIYFNGPSWYIVDPICTFMFSILVMFTTFSILKDAMLVLMEGMPKGVEYGEVLETLLSIDNVLRVHNLRIWALSLDKTALAAHIVISPEANTDEILKIASGKIHAKYNFFEMTLQIEYFQERMEDCKQCQDSEK